MKKKAQYFILGILLLSAFFILISSNSMLISNKSDNRIKTSNGGYGVYWVEAGENGDGSSETSPAGNITYILNNYDIEDKIIKVKEGWYTIFKETFPLIIDKKNVTIEAVGSRDNTIIDSYGLGYHINDGDEYIGFIIKNHSVTIKGFNFFNCSVPVKINGGIYQLENISIENNLMSLNSYGIYAQNIKNSLFKNNIFTLSSIQWAIMLSSGIKTKIINNSIKGSDDHGINIAAGRGNILENNNVSNNPDVGIWVHDESNDNILRNNIINYNGDQAILIESYCDNNSVIENEIKGNVKNYVSNPSVFAIEIGDSNRTSIINNNITDSQADSGSYAYEGGISLDNAHNTTIFRNNISNNDGNGVYITNSINDNITLNIIQNNGMHGNRQLYLYNTNETIIDKNIIETDHNQYISFLDDSSSNVILRNNFTNSANNNEIFGDADSFDNLIYKNNFYSSSAVYFFSGNHLNSSIIGNYWRSYTGTDSNGDHIGEESKKAGGAYDYMPAMEPIDIMDTTDPTISITDPSDDEIVCTNFTVEWNANDDKEILYYALLLENYGWNFTDDLNNWTYTNIDNGSYTNKVYVVDKGWNYVLDKVSIIVDKTPDSVIIDSPILFQDYVSNQIDINVTIHGIHSSVDTVIAYLDGGAGIPLAQLSTNKWNFSNYLFSDGIHTLEIYANDTCGNINFTESVTFTVDTATPLVAFESPGNATYHTKFIDINATVTDATSTISSVIAEIDETDNISLTNSIENPDLFCFLDREFDEGPHKIRIYAYDTVGNINSTELLYFTVDTDTINITINNPIVSTTYTSLSVLINATMDNETVIDTVLAEINGLQNLSLTQNGDFWSILHIFNEEGNTVRIYANDTYGNDALTTIVSFNIDTLPPIWNPIPSNQSIELGDDLSYDCDATDASGVTYSLNDTTYFSIDSSSGLITNNGELEEGVYWLEIIAQDPYGHSESAVIKVNVEDTTTPNPSPGGAIPGFPMLILCSLMGISVLIVLLKRKHSQ